MKSKAKSKRKKEQDSVGILLQVTEYSVRICTGRSSIPSANYAGTDLGYVTLEGKCKEQPGVHFEIHVLPDGSAMPASSYDPKGNVVMMYLNWSQFPSLLALLSGVSTGSVQGVFTEEDGAVTQSDIEGTFTITAGPPS